MGRGDFLQDFDTQVRPIGLGFAGKQKENPPGIFGLFPSRAEPIQY